MKKNHKRTLSCCFLILAVSQIFDFYFTYTGVNTFGLAIEANFIISFMINILGILPALLIAKITALVLIYYLYKSSSIITKGYLYMLLAVTVLYIWCVISWFYIWSVIL